MAQSQRVIGDFSELRGQMARAFWGEPVAETRAALPTNRNVLTEMLRQGTKKLLRQAV